MNWLIYIYFSLSLIVFSCVSVQFVYCVMCIDCVGIVNVLAFLTNSQNSFHWNSTRNLIQSQLKQIPHSTHFLRMRCHQWNPPHGMALKLPKHWKADTLVLLCTVASFRFLLKQKIRPIARSPNDTFSAHVISWVMVDWISLPIEKVSNHRIAQVLHMKRSEEIVLWGVF